MTRTNILPTYTGYGLAPFGIQTSPVGYNQFSVSSPLYRNKGTMLYIYCSTGCVGLDGGQSLNPYSDYYWSYTSPLSKLNSTSNWRVYARIITNGKASSSLSLSRNFSTAGLRQLSANLTCNDTGIIVTAAPLQIVVNDGKYKIH